MRIRILSAQYDDGREVPQDVLIGDWGKVVEIASQNTEPMFDMFGGMVFVEDRQYQVAWW